MVTLKLMPSPLVSYDNIFSLINTTQLAKDLTNLLAHYMEM